MELAGKHVVVTGAGSGIGRACATRFAAEGARVVASDRDGDRAHAVAEAIGALAVSADVSRESEITGLIAAAQAEHVPSHSSQWWQPITSAIAAIAENVIHGDRLHSAARARSSSGRLVALVIHARRARRSRWPQTSHR